MFTKELWEYILRETYYNGYYDFDWITILFLMIGSIATIILDIVTIPLQILAIIFKYVLEKILNRK